MEAARIKWILDPAHSEIGFKVEQLMSTYVKGVFREFDACIYTSGESFMIYEIDLLINPASIDTGDAARDEHLKSPAFFDIENYKHITFFGYTYQRMHSKGSYELFGDLTIKGITRQVKMDVEAGGLSKKSGFNIKGKINRGDWGLTWNTALEVSGILVDYDVIINCTVCLCESEMDWQVN